MSGVLRPLGMDMPGWMDTGVSAEIGTSGFRDVGTDRRLLAPTGVTRIMTVIKMDGIITTGIGIAKITATTAMTVKTVVKTTARTIAKTNVKMTGTSLSN